jgi:hypothetical protein
MKKIEVTIDRIPGLNTLVEKLTNSLNVFVFTTLEPYMKPILSAATQVSLSSMLLLVSLKLIDGLFFSRH